MLDNIQINTDTTQIYNKEDIVIIRTTLKIKNRSILNIGNLQIGCSKRFNALQKIMYKLLLGINVENI